MAADEDRCTRIKLTLSLPAGFLQNFYDEWRVASRGVPERQIRAPSNKNFHHFGIFTKYRQHKGFMWPAIPKALMFALWREGRRPDPHHMQEEIREGSGPAPGGEEHERYPAVLRKRGDSLGCNGGLRLPPGDDEQKGPSGVLHKLNGFNHGPKIGRRRPHQNDNQVGNVNEGGGLV